APFAGVASAQSAISVSVTQQDTDIIIQVTQGNQPVEGATVEVTGISNSTPLDGNYTTNRNGVVVFDGNQTEGLQGVIHLRIDVRTQNRYKSVLTTITRSPDVRKSAPLGQRISMGLQNSVASTRGTVNGNIFITRVESVATDENKVEILRDHAVQILDKLEEKRVERNALGRMLATGSISPSKFYVRMVENWSGTESL
ncbi:MAG: hypothetical protein SXQ77_03620, partial [Halobacteria archaeon]|nr:hypothetical protein [Halobacteria archaeon]